MVRRRGDQRGLTTLLFTDIVNSTEVAVELGDRRWRSLQSRHHAEVRRQLKRHGGREVDTAGDGFFATFGSPAAGVRCAFAIVRVVRELGLDIRAGLHIGEAELAGEKVGGIAVTTAQRVESAAGPGQVLATDTIVHLVAGSGLEFTDLGQRELKGVPGRWELFSLDAVDGESIGPPLELEQASEFRQRASPVEHVTERRRILWGAALALATLLAATVIVISRQQSNGLPQPPTESPAVQGTLAILSSATGEVVDRPPNVTQSAIAGAVGTSGPIVLTAPAGAGPQAFAWIMSGGPGGGPQHLQQLDQAGGAVIETTPVSSCVSPPGCLAETAGNLWFLVAPDPVKYAVFAQAIDLSTGRWARPVLVGRNIAVRSEIRGMAAGAGALWIGDTVNSRVYRFDLRTERVVNTYAIGGSVDDLAFGNGYLWVIDAAGDTLTRLNPVTGAKKRLPLNQAGYLKSVTVGGGYVWITDDTDGVVWRVDRNMSEPTSVAVGDHPYDAVYADGTVWVANHGDQTVSEVDPVLAQQTATHPVGIQPRTLAVTSGSVWVVGDRVGAIMS
jgi:class 3 adenylate cyclase